MQKLEEYRQTLQDKADADYRERIAPVLKRTSSKSEAARQLKMSRQRLYEVIRRAEDRGIA